VVAEPLLLLPFVRLIIGFALFFSSFRIFATVINALDFDSTAVEAVRLKSRWSALIALVVVYTSSTIDNTLAIAALAQDTFLVIVALSVSIALLMFACGALARVVLRFALIFLGAGIIIAWSAASIVAGDPALATLPFANSLLLILRIAFIAAFILLPLPLLTLSRQRRTVAPAVIEERIRTNLK
jgi:predicted tellurium resistance membrane protein TerC